MKMESDSGDGLMDGLRRRWRETGWYSLSGGADPCQGICLVVVGPWHVKELAPFEVPTDLLDEESIARHVCILGVPVAR